jgi:hypothetical protein
LRSVGTFGTGLNKCLLAKVFAIFSCNRDFYFVSVASAINGPALY